MPQEEGAPAGATPIRLFGRGDHIIVKFLAREPLGTVQSALRQQLPRLVAEDSRLTERAPNPILGDIAARDHGRIDDALAEKLPDHQPVREPGGGVLADYLGRARTFEFIHPSGDIVSVTAPVAASAEGTTAMLLSIDVSGARGMWGCRIPSVRRGIAAGHVQSVNAAIERYVNERSVLRAVREIVG